MDFSVLVCPKSPVHEIGSDSPTCCGLKLSKATRSGTSLFLPLASDNFCLILLCRWRCPGWGCGAGHCSVETRGFPGWWSCPSDPSLNLSREGCSQQRREGRARPGLGRGRAGESSKVGLTSYGLAPAWFRGWAAGSWVLLRARSPPGISSFLFHSRVSSNFLFFFFFFQSGNS